MFFHDISFITVICSALVSMALGFVWYSPFLFGKRWNAEMGHTEESLKSITNGSGMVRTYTVGSALALVTAYCIAVIFNSVVFVGLSGLIIAALVLWMGFMLPVMVNGFLYAKDSLVLLAINASYQLVSILLMSFIIGIFG